MCICDTEDETVGHFFLRCPNFIQQRLHLMNEINKINVNLHLLNESVLMKILLYGDIQFSNEINSRILHLTIEFIHSSKRFDMQLF